MAGGQVVVTIVGNASQLQGVLGKAAGDLDGFAGKMQAAGQKMTSIGKSLTLGLTVPIVGVGIAAFKAAQDFESAFAGVTKTVEGTDAQMAALRQGIIDMSKELPASTTEIAAVAEAAGALGIATEDVLSFTRVMIDLGETTDLTADTAATSIAQIANLMGIAGEEFDNLGAALVDLGNNGASTESQILEFTTRIAGAGATVGLTTQQVLGISSAMANVGIEAEAGGTSIQKTFLEMLMAAEIGGDAMATWAEVAGTSADEFAEKFRVDAGGAFVDFIKGLQRIEAEGGSVISVLDELGIREARQVRAILALVASGTNLEDSIARANVAWGENTALTAEAQQRYETNAAKMQILKNRLKDVLRVLGESLMPIIEKFAGWLTKLAEKWKTLSPETQKFILIAAALAAVLGPLLIVLGSLATAVGALLSPVGLVIVALIAIVAAAVLVWTKWDEIWNFIKDHPAIAIIVGILAAPIAAFVLIIGALKWLYENWSSIWDDISFALDKVWNLVIRPIYELMVTIGRTVMDGVRDAWNDVGKPIFDAIGEAIGIALFVINTYLKPIWDGLFDALRLAWENVGKPALDAILPVLQPIIAAAKELRDIFDFLFGGKGAYNGGPAGDGSPFGAGKTIEGATGGIVTRPTFALIGEAGPEAVVPLNKTPGSSPLPTGFGSAGHTFNIYTLDPEAAANAAVRKLRRAQYLENL